MESKNDGTAQALKEDAEHSESQQNEAEHADDDHAHADDTHAGRRARTRVAPENLKEVITELKARGEPPPPPPDDIGGEAFLKLIQNPEFISTLEAVCRRALSRYRLGSSYSWQDLSSEVMIKFAPWYWQYKGQASLKTVLYRFVRNHLIDLHRKPDERCLSFEDLQLEERLARTPQRRALSDVEDGIRVRELMEHLRDDKERRLFVEYVLEGKTASEVARGTGVSRQAVTKRVKKMLDRLRPLL